MKSKDDFVTADRVTVRIEFAAHAHKLAFRRRWEARLFVWLIRRRVQVPDYPSQQPHIPNPGMPSRSRRR